MTTLTDALRRIHNMERDAPPLFEGVGGAEQGLLAASAPYVPPRSERDATPLASPRRRRRGPLADAMDQWRLLQRRNAAEEGPLALDTSAYQVDVRPAAILALKQALRRQFDERSRRLKGQVLLFVRAGNNERTGSMVRLARDSNGGLVSALGDAVADGGRERVLLIDSRPAVFSEGIALNAPTTPPIEADSARARIRSWRGLIPFIVNESADFAWPQTSVARARMALGSAAISSVELTALMDECRESYTWTLVEAGNWTDGNLFPLARRSDAVYVMLQQDATLEGEARRVIRELRGIGAAVGCLLHASSLPRRVAA